jgi:hypothetical protein
MMQTGNETLYDSNCYVGGNDCIALHVHKVQSIDVTSMLPVLRNAGWQ